MVGSAPFDNNNRIKSMRDAQWRGVRPWEGGEEGEEGRRVGVGGEQIKREREREGERKREREREREKKENKTSWFARFGLAPFLRRVWATNG